MQNPPFYAQQRPAGSTARQGRNGWGMMALVFAGAMIGGFVVWPIIRPLIVLDDPRASYSAAAGFEHGDRQDVRPHARGRR